MSSIKEIDRAILAELRNNARVSYVNLAKKVGASERTVRTHVKSLEESGIIRGYTIGTLAGEIAGWDGIEMTYEVSGETDLISLAHVNDTMALRQLLDRIWMAAPVEIASTTTELVLEQY